MAKQLNSTVMSELVRKGEEMKVNGLYACMKQNKTCSSPDTLSLQMAKDCSKHQVVWLNVHVVHLCLGGILVQVSLMALSGFP